MIKLFRNIRQKLLAEGKTSRYLKYAIGEIILVVVGILIALSINTWNEERKEKAIVENVLKNIRVDLQADTTKFARDLKRIPPMLVDSKALLNSTFPDTLSANALYELLPYSAFNYQVKDQSYEKVISAGITDFFEYNTLFEKIDNYYTIDSNAYNVITKWDSDDNIDDGKLWLTMDFEIDIYKGDFYKENDIQFVQNEVNRKAVFLEKLREPTTRNAIKMNTYRKMRMIKTLTEMKQNATQIILEINQQLEE